MDQDREALVAALLTGERSADEPQVQERLRGDPELRAMLERMRAMQDIVTSAAAEQREVLADASAELDPKLASRVAAAVRLVVAERRRTKRRLWLWAAVPLAAGILGWFYLGGPPTAPAHTDLGSDPGLEPHGRVEQYSPFRWLEPPPASGRFELRIYDVQDGRRGTLLYPPKVENVTSPWTLPREVEASLPDQIWWEVELFGDEPRIWHAHAWRR